MQVFRVVISIHLSAGLLSQGTLDVDVQKAPAATYLSQGFSTSVSAVAPLDLWPSHHTFLLFFFFVDPDGIRERVQSKSTRLKCSLYCLEAVHAPALHTWLDWCGWWKLYFVVLRFASKFFQSCGFRDWLTFFDLGALVCHKNKLSCGGFKKGFFYYFYFYFILFFY